MFHKLASLGTEQPRPNTNFEDPTYSEPNRSSMAEQQTIDDTVSSEHFVRKYSSHQHEKPSNRPDGTQQLLQGCDNLTSLIRTLNTKLLSVAFNKVRNWKGRDRRTFHNIEIETIAQQKIIPYISEVYLRNKTQSGAGRDLRRSDPLPKRAVLRRNHDKLTFTTAQNQKLASLCFLLERIVPQRLGVSGFEAIRSVSRMSPMASRSVNEDSTALKQPAIAKVSHLCLPLKIIMKYTQKAVLCEAMGKLKDFVRKLKLNKCRDSLTKAVNRSLRNAMDRVRCHSRRVFSSVQLARTLEERLAIRELQLKMDGFIDIKIRMAAVLKHKRHEKALYSARLVVDSLSKKIVKLLFSGFMRIRELSHRVPSSSRTGQPSKDLRQFLFHLHSFINVKVQQVISDDCYDTDRTKSLNMTQASHRSRSPDSACDEYPELVLIKHKPSAIEIGSSLPLEAITEERPLTLRSSSFSRELQHRQLLRPLHRDTLPELEGSMTFRPTDRNNESF